MRMVLLLALVAACALVVVPTGLAAKPGNSVNAKQLCKKGGWKSWYRSDGTPFKNQGQCVSYAAKGGKLSPPPATFRSTCESLGGTYGSGGTVFGFPVSHRCDWAAFTPLSNWISTINALWPYCAGYNPADVNTYPHNSRSSGDPFVGAIGCRVF